MEKRIILLNGPSSSGKSTLARALRAALEEGRGERFEIVSIDSFLRMTATEKLYEDDVYAISGELCAAVAAALKTAPGVIVDHVITSERIFRQLRESLRPCRLYLVRVTCPLAELRRREAARGDRCPGSAEASAAYLYPREGYDLTVDTRAMSAAECAAQICSGLFPARERT